MTGHRPGRVRRARRLVVPSLLLALAVVGPAGPAAAHASLVGTDPVDGAVLEGSPGSVTLTFDEPVRVAGETARLFDAEGGPVDSSVSGEGTEVVVDVPDELAEGSYLLSWRVLSADGHPITGSVSFSVGAPSAAASAPPPEPESSTAVTTVLSLTQGVGYVALLLAGGLVFLAALLLPRHAATDPVRARVRRLAVAGAVAATLAFLAVVPLSLAYQLGLGIGDLLSARLWSVDLISEPLLVALLVAGGLAVAVGLVGDRAPERAGRVAVLGAAGAAVVAPVLVGHSRSTDPTLLMLAADTFHLVAGAIWLGGLVGLAAAIPGLAARPELAARTLARFSTWAGGVVVVLTVTGSFMAWRIVGSWSGLVDTTYGRLLLLKIALALVVVGVAAWNRFVLLPRVRAAAGSPDGGRRSVGVARTAAVEATVLVALLLVTGFLVSGSPRAADTMVPASTGAVVGSLSDDVRVVGLLTPGTTGPNTLLMQVQTAAGDPLETYAEPQVTVRSDTVDLGQVPLVGSDVGSYRAEVVLPSQGPWEIQVSLRESEFENPVTTLQFTD